MLTHSSPDANLPSVKRRSLIYVGFFVDPGTLRRLDTKAKREGRNRSQQLRIIIQQATKDI